LLVRLNSFIPFLRGEKTTIWAQSTLNYCSETLELEINNKINKFKQAISLIQTASQQLQRTLNIKPLLNLGDIEVCITALKHILQAPSNLPNNWTGLDILIAQNAFSKIKADVKVIGENELLLKRKYHPELFSSELPALANRYQKYNRFWLMRIFNSRYRRDVKLLKKLSIKKGQLSHNELKRDLAQAVQIQAARNELYQSNYPARQVFGSLFNPEISSEAELKEIEQALSWLTGLHKYSLPADSVQQLLNSPSGRRELAELVKKLESLPEDISQGINFLFLYFNENDITGQYQPRNQILFTDLATFLNIAQSDLPNFREWLTYKEIYGQLENLRVENFLDALRDNKPNPIESVRNKLRQTEYQPRQVFGSLFNPEVSGKAELKEIEQALSWLTGLQKYSLSADSVQRILNSPSKRRKLSELLKKYESVHHCIRQGLDFLLSHFDESDITDSYLPRNQITFVELERFLNLAQSELPYFQEWLTYKETYQKLENLGNNKFLDALRDNKIQPEQWFLVLEKRIYQICLDAILAKKPELKNFNFEVHERQIKEFSKLDFNQLDTARKRLKQLHLQRWQNWEKTSLALAEIPNLKKEAAKKSRHLPIRKLLNDTQKGIPNLVKALKPCWMMSPLSVSQYINPDVLHFDVLIFDEASQLRTEDVVPSIIRSNQVIVIGDNKQLPPTSFFSTGDSQEDIDDEDDAIYESVLDECSKFMFGRTLKWHYRSQDERLIAFSNHHFYDDKLVTFPNPVQNPDLGVWFKHVSDGVYDRGKRRDNRREAQVVAQLALEHFQGFPEQSLGIIAFSEAQADAIREQIEILGKEYPDLEIFCSDNSPQFFLKALENVQGDERDAIMLSVGYARDDQGKLSLNFGPLNRQGGERRLNVAVTRAKSKITLVSSIVAGDIDKTRAQSKGVKLLHDYLEYAASGGERLRGNSYTDRLNFDSPFEEDVYHALVQQGYTIRTQVGCSGYRIDLGVVNNDRPGEFLLGIECDGASYHNSPTARDRDRLRQQVLERLGWEIHRIWSTDWFRNKPVQVRLLTEKIKQLQQINS
jgi:superfamily I DNA and/or RNA helicase/very-short-patch-repair endonuclease